MPKISDQQKCIIDSLEGRGCYTLAERFRFILASKETRRKSKIEAIKLSAEVRDKLESIAHSVLMKRVGPGVKDMATLLDSEFDRLEDKIAKIIMEYLEFKSNNEGVPEHLDEFQNKVVVKKQQTPVKEEETPEETPVEENKEQEQEEV